MNEARPKIFFNGSYIQLVLPEWIKQRKYIYHTFTHLTLLEWMKRLKVCNSSYTHIIKSIIASSSSSSSSSHSFCSTLDRLICTLYERTCCYSFNESYMHLLYHHLHHHIILIQYIIRRFTLTSASDNLTRNVADQIIHYMFNN